ncbi:TetR family transcriptional regulator [Marinitenerispora sediminis]|uniref:TetR family transcriptional regulator n=1 Tax=Marinitenerispora sediminis TaxID=1931232 RepID=A0A368T6T5_9ACTN|nr:TetR family transcriptional regulator [Marinitenerispora sediminis]RCV54209.1 TetR family transcriptional regulator [Marinitenerispora sediminis]RCV59508.1 TetR family transcriptional regulator [Marinitenerispora sediminis]RCV59763.1 TetR family transcriptional regulator [Marinitenerispora sediminis]
MTSTSPPPAPATERLPLRERKKLRTRQALVDTALRMFTERGFDATTLDELCEAVEVSKRTFFRTFASKEDVALAPVQDLWHAVLDDLSTRLPDGRPVLHQLQDTMLATVGRMAADGWTERLRASRRLISQVPAVEAHSLHFCNRTSRAAIAILRQRLALPDPGDPRPRLALGMLLTAVDCALDAWASRPGPATRTGLAADLRAAFAAIPDGLTLTAGPAGPGPR